MGLTGPILVTGAGGLLGATVVEALGAAGADVTGLRHAELDVADRAAVRRAVRGLRPAAVVNCAAMTGVDDCETDPDACRAPNAVGPAWLAEAAATGDAEIVHISTDYVFDGTKGSPYVETDEPSPVQVYGRCKLDGEIAVREHNARHYVLRTAMVFGPSGRNFLSRLPDLIASSRPIALVTDQNGSPTYAPDLADAIAHVLGTQAYGLYHVSNAGGCTMIEFCSVVADALGLEPDITRLTRDALDRPATRPADTRLDGPAWRAAGFEPLRGWEAAAAEFMSG